MSTNRPVVRLGHLYPDHLNIYADRGNVAVFQRRLEWRGLTLEVVEVGLGDEIPDDCNLYYLGGGQDRDQLLVAQDLVAKADSLRRAADGGAAVLAVCGGYQLMGHSYVAANGQKMAGTGLLDLETTAGTDRLIGDVVLSVNLDGRTGTVVGYENHAGRTRLGSQSAPRWDESRKATGTTARTALRAPYRAAVSVLTSTGRYCPRTPGWPTPCCDGRWTTPAQTLNSNPSTTHSNKPPTQPRWQGQA